ncbi:cysteine proteinase [Trichoderma austrokoningii]
MEAETLEQMQARHRRELKDLQGRITSKKKNATKKTRKGVNDECAEMERQLREKQGSEVAALNGEVEDDVEDETQEPEQKDETPSGTEELENATAKLNIEEEKNNDSQQQQQQPGKKRNRQKERLARRAAEQEAAMLSAEQEASSMTDHRARESTYMKKAFAANQLAEKDIQPDGHCLFSALADQLSHNGIPLGDTKAEEPAYKTMRKTATGYMEEHADEFAPFLEEDFEAYVTKMRDTAEWGGQLELMAVARRYGVEIRVIQDGRTERISGGQGDETETKKTLWLAYYRHGYGLGEHYNSLRRATTTTMTTTTD